MLESLWSVMFLAVAGVNEPAPPAAPEAPAPAAGKPAPPADKPADKPAPPAEKAEPAPAIKDERTSGSRALVTGQALRDELKRSVRARQVEQERLDQERAALAEDRKRLEEMSREVDGARKQMRTEIDRLEGLLAEMDRRKENCLSNLAAETANPAAAAPAGNPAAAPAAANPSAAVRHLGAGAASSEGADVVAKAVKSMRPKQAGALLEKLDEDVAVAVLVRLSPKDAAAVLSAMPPAKAAALATQMSRATPPPGSRP